MSWEYIIRYLQNISICKNYKTNCEWKRNKKLLKKKRSISKKKHIQARLFWAKRAKKFNNEQLSKLVFTDETKLKLFKDNDA